MCKVFFINSCSLLKMDVQPNRLNIFVFYQIRKKNISIICMNEIKFVILRQICIA